MGEAAFFQGRVQSARASRPAAQPLSLHPRSSKPAQCGRPLSPTGRSPPRGQQPSEPAWANHRGPLCAPTGIMANDRPGTDPDEPTNWARTLVWPRAPDQDILEGYPRGEDAAASQITPRKLTRAANFVNVDESLKEELPETVYPLPPPPARTFLVCFSSSLARTLERERALLWTPHQRARAPLAAITTELSAPVYCS